MLRRNLGTIAVISFFILLPLLVTFDLGWVRQFKQSVNKEVFYFVPYWTFSIAAFLGYRFNLYKMIFISSFFLMGYTIFRNAGEPANSLVTTMPTVQLFMTATLLSMSFLFLLPLKRLFGRDGIINLAAVFLPLVGLSIGMKHWPLNFASFYAWQIPGVHLTNLPGTTPVLVALFGLCRVANPDRYLKQLHKFAFFALWPVLYTFEKGSMSHFDLAVAFVASGGLLLSGMIKIDWEKVYFDELTEIPNRRALNESLKVLGGKYTLAMIDIDHFKKFNDSYGHEEGDRVLRMVALHLDRESHGRAYRYGGEEFTLIYDGKTPSEVTGEIDKIREMLADRPFHIRSSKRPKSVSKQKVKAMRAETSSSSQQRKPVQVTVSIGVASSSEGPNTEEVIKVADQRLYQAKEKGRNRVVSPAEPKESKKAS